MYIHILMLDAMEVLTYARYLMDIFNQKLPIPKTEMLMFVERWSDGLPNKMGNSGVPTISCLIGTQKFDQALYDHGASVSVMPKVIYDQLNHDSLVPTSMFHASVAGGSIDLASSRNCGRYPSENQEFFRTDGLRGTRNGCLSSETTYSWESILEYRWSHD
jgi:hypothetical protein